MKQRIARLLKEENLTSGRLAERIGVQPSSVSHVIAGRNKPGYDFIVSVLRHFPTLNPDWLILGEGEMYRQVSVVPDSLPESAEISPQILSLSDEPVEEPNPEKEVRIEETEQKGEIQVQVIDKQIDKIIVFYTDRTFSAYTEAPFI